MDPVGKLFSWNGRIFRKIYNKSKKYVLDIIESDMFKELVNRNMFVNTWLSDSVTFGDDDIILESEFINCKVYPANYTIEHVRCIACMLLELNNVLIQHGYILADPHFANILFDGSVPIYIDLGSIVPIDTGGLSAWYYFLAQYYYPLFFMHIQGKNSFQICKDIVLRNGYFDNNFEDYLYLSYGNILGKFFVKIEKLKRNKDFFIFNGFNVIYSQTNSYLKNFVKHLIRFFVVNILKSSKENYLKKKIYIIRKKINSMHFYYNSQWGDYQDEYSGKVGERFIKISKMIEPLQISTCLELAANQGVFCKYLLENNIIKQAVCTDYDTVALGKGFSEVSENNSINKKITFSYLNIMAMTSGDIEKKCELIRSDVVVALAVTHHLLLTQKIEINSLLNFFKHCTNRYIIVEFMPLGLWNGISAPELPEWYNLDWFLKNLKKYFTIHKVEQLEKNRIVILGELYNINRS